MCTVGLLFAIATAPASAVSLGHIHDFEFGGQGTGAGQFSSGMGLGIDQSTGDVYVSDTENHRIQKFDAAGNFLLTWGYGVANGNNEFQVCAAPGPCQAGLPGSAPGQLSSPRGVVVDNSGGPNDGDVYVVMNPTYIGHFVGDHAVFRFSSNGAYLGKINGAASPGGVFAALQFRAIDIDDQGFLWVIDDNGSGTRVMRFSNQPSNAYVGGSQWIVKLPNTFGDPEPTPAFSISADPSGSAVYLQTYFGLYRFIANGAASRLHISGVGGIAIDSSTGHSYAGYGNGIQEFDDNPDGPLPVGPSFGEGKFCCGISALDVHDASNSVYAANYTNGKVHAFKTRRVPETVTEPATEVRHTTATLNGHTAPDPIEGGPVSECHFEWGPTTSYGNVTACDQTTPLGSATDVSLDLAGLTMETTYHYRLVTANSIDDNIGEDMTFTPRAVLDLSTDTSSEVAASTATLNASFDPNGEQTSYYFEWGKTAAYGNVTAEAPGKDAGSTPGLTAVSEKLEGLEDYSTYHYRIVATNPLGTSYGPDRTFRTTPPDPPIVSGTASSLVTDTTANLGALVNPNFGETIYGFEFGETPAYGTQVLGTELLAADDTGHAVEAEIGGLTPGRTYHFRAIAINFGGITYGADETLATLAAPGVLTTEVTNVNQSGARLSALVHSGLSATNVRFEYGHTPSYGASTGAIPIGAGNLAVPVSIDVGGLSAGATYHFRAVAVNGVGTALGPDQSFGTAALAPPPPATSKRLKCKRGFVRRGGKCVRKQKRRAKRRKANTRHHRNATSGDHRIAR